VVVVYFKVFAWLCWGNSRRTQESLSSGRDLKPGPSKYEARVLLSPYYQVCPTIEQTCRNHDAVQDVATTNYM